MDAFSDAPAKVVLKKVITKSKILMTGLFLFFGS